MGYERTQHAPVHHILLAVAVTLLIGAWVARAEPVAVILLVGVTATLVLVALMFGSSTVSDEGDCLALHYGPLPVFHKLLGIFSGQNGKEQMGKSGSSRCRLECLPGLR